MGEASRFDLSGRVALITGGSRGLGREMALGFASAGAEVLVVSRKLDACEATAKEIEATTGQRARAFACNVARWGEVDALVEAVYAEVGRVDVLVNNAGSSPLYPSLVEVSEDLYDKVLDLNLKGPFRLSVLIGTRMAEGNGGSIINIGARAATKPTPHALPYAAAKAGLASMTLSFAHAFAPKVRVNYLEVGYFLTDISKAWDPEGFAERARTRIALGRGGDPTEIVGAALYLASDAAGYTTGAVLRVDGGLD